MMPGSGPTRRLTTVEALDIVRQLAHPVMCWNKHDWLLCPARDRSRGHGAGRFRFRFAVEARRAPGEPLTIDCRALKIRLDDLDSTMPIQAVACFYELLEALAWLAVCPGCTVSENPSLWQQIVEMLVNGKERVLDAHSLTFEDPTTFPRWIFHVVPKYSEAGYFGNECFVQELFERSSDPQKTAVPSAEYANFLARIRPLIQQSTDDPQPTIRVGIHVHRLNFVYGHFQALRAFVQGLRSAPTNRMRLDFLGLTLYMYVPYDEDDLGTAGLLRDLRALLDENCDVPISEISVDHDLPAELPYGPESDFPLTDQIIQECGQLLHRFIRPPLGFSVSKRIRLVGVHTAEAATVCAALRSSSQPIDHLELFWECGIQQEVMNWLAFGLFHRSSPARVRVLELQLSNNIDGFVQLSKLLASDRPGEVLIGRTIPPEHREEVTYPLLGTLARLMSGTIDLHRNCFCGNPEYWATSVTYAEAPEFEVLATLSEWVGVLVPEHGYRWVKRSVVECIWRDDVYMNEAHGVQSLIIGGDHTAIPGFLQEIGETLQSLRVNISRSSSSDSLDEEAIDRIIRACRQLVTLDLPSIRLDPIVKAYEEGRCVVRSLVVHNNVSEESGAIAHFLAMLKDSHHPGASTLQKLVFRFNAWKKSRYNCLSLPMGRDIVHQIMWHSAKLREFYLESHDYRRLIDDGDIDRFNGWSKTHPLVLLKSVGGPVGTVIRELDKDLWSVILSFTGPHRRVRVQAWDSESY